MKKENMALVQKKQDLPVDSWMERFFDWLQKQELTKKT
jgi:hypothetical protein